MIDCENLNMSDVVDVVLILQPKLKSFKYINNLFSRRITCSSTGVVHIPCGVAHLQTHFYSSFIMGAVQLVLAVSADIRMHTT